MVSSARLEQNIAGRPLHPIFRKPVNPGYQQAIENLGMFLQLPVEHEPHTQLVGCLFSYIASRDAVAMPRSAKVSLATEECFLVFPSDSMHPGVTCPHFLSSSIYSREIYLGSIVMMIPKSSEYLGCLTSVVISRAEAK